jgi:hypothetical protein
MAADEHDKAQALAVWRRFTTGRRRVIDFFLGPVRKVANEGLRER